MRPVGGLMMIVFSSGGAGLMIPRRAGKFVQ
jgi:hypothetical protein